MGNRHKAHQSNSRVFFIALSAGIVALALCLAVTGCGNSTQANEAAYQKTWVKIMGDFEAQVNKDDTKANALVQKNDISGLIALVNQRIAKVDVAMGKILALDPPQKYRKLHATTLYYLVTLKDRLTTQNDVNQAALAGKPTTDLKSIADTAAARSQLIGRELGIELQTLGIKLGNTGATQAPTNNQQNSATQSATQP